MHTNGEYRSDDARGASQGVSGTGVEKEAERTTEAAREAGSKVKTFVTQSVRDTVEDRRRAAAEETGRLARSMREAGRGSGTAEALFGEAADRLDGVSQTLERKNAEDLWADVEHFARRQPALFFAATVAGGLAVARFLKSTSRDETIGERPMRSGTGPSGHGA